MQKHEIQTLIDRLQATVDTLPDYEPLGCSVKMQVVTEKRAAELTGYSQDQLRGRRKSGAYEFGVIWWHDAFGKVVYDLDALQESMRCHHPQKANSPESRRAAMKSGSGSAGRANAAGNLTPLPTRLQV